MMTDTEVAELFEDTPLMFDSYYKYSFTFCGEKDGYKIVTSFGGNSYDIYRYDVSRDVVKYFSHPYEWSFVSITKDGEKVFELLNY